MCCEAITVAVPQARAVIVDMEEGVVNSMLKVITSICCSAARVLHAACVRCSARHSEFRSVNAEPYRLTHRCSLHAV